MWKDKKTLWFDLRVEKRRAMKIRALATMLSLIALLFICCTACSRATPTPAPPAAVTLVDDAGRTVTITPHPQRLVSLAPNNTEFLFALGLGDKVVGVSDFSNYPPEAAKIETVGGMPLNFEKIVALKPELILAAGITSPADVSKLEELGLTVLVLNPSDIKGILHSIELVGQATGTEVQAKALAGEIEARVEAVTHKTGQATEQPRVFLELDETLYTVGPGSFIDALISMAGGTNIASDASSPYPQFSAEEIIRRNPQVIILADADYGVTPEAVKSRPGWEAISAVKNDAIYPINADIISRPGPRIAQGLEALAKIIHPELFQ